MQKVSIEAKKAGDCAVIEMSVGNVTAIYRRFGDRSKVEASGRGNVRQVKALLRECVRNAYPALI